MGWWEKIRSRVLAEPEGTHEDEGDLRLPSRIRGSCRVERGSPFKVEIRSLSVNGLTFRCDRRIKPSQEVVVRVPLGEDVSVRTTEIVELRARVAWARQAGASPDWDIGVTYPDEADLKRDEWLNRILETYGVNLWDERRSAMRHHVELPAVIYPEGRPTVQSTVRNLSAGGMQVCVEDINLAVNDGVLVELSPDEGMWVKLKGRIVNEVTVGQTRLLGVRFDLVRDAQREALLEMIIRMLKPPETPMEE